MRIKLWRLQIVIGRRQFGNWHDHDWDSVVLAPGPIDEETDDGVRRHWFFNRVPFHRWHSVRFPWIMVIVHGRQIQDHVECHRVHYATIKKIHKYYGTFEAFLEAKNEELATKRTRVLCPRTIELAVTSRQHCEKLRDSPSRR